MPEMTPFQELIYTRTYSRWVDEKQRREIYPETVDRYMYFFKDKFNGLPVYAQDKMTWAMNFIHGLEVMPSMRALWTAGEALKRENLASYNCSSTIVDDPKVFSEALYLLLNGTGFGFDVGREFISQLPTVPENLIESDKVIVFEDSKKGWAVGFDEFIQGLYEGNIYKLDYSLIRPKGARLKTFGGRASGKYPLQQLIEFAKQTFIKARGRKLNSLECHDILCYVASIVIVGGVRRAACASLSNLSDMRMRDAKAGEFWLKNPQRALANNSVAYTEKPDCSRFMEEWLALIKSQTGERGIYNREGVIKCIKEKTPDRDINYSFVPNPCFEATLRPNGLCNLTEVVVRPNDSLEYLKHKVEAATIIGCLQTTLTDFDFVRDIWKKNCEEERLLGVSLTGLRDHKLLKTVSEESKQWLTELRHHARYVADKWAKILGINTPASITMLKPSGSVSLLVDSSAGLHTRFSPYYIRRVRIAKTDPLCKMLIEQGVRWQPEVNQNIDDFTTAVFEFPIKAPDGAITNKDISAIEALEYWHMIKTYYCEHSASVTIFVGDDEWLEVGNWVYKHWDDITGIAFLPKDGSIYPLAPYEEITEKEYNVLVSVMPKVDYSQLTKYELEDMTEGATEYACVGGACELK